LYLVSSSDGPFAAFLYQLPRYNFSFFMSYESFMLLALDLVFLMLLRICASPQMAGFALYIAFPKLKVLLICLNLI
jgi:hypothetical protein